MSRAPAVFPALILALTLSSSIINNAEAACFLERGLTTPGEHDVYTCVRSQDFAKDLGRLPNITKFVNIVFRDSIVKKIEKESFQKLGTKALGISIVHCGLNDIHEEAFHGITELKALILRRNLLVDVKQQWFKNLAKLESLDLSGNMIQKFDPAIFSLTPMIQEFQISENQLTHFDVEAMKTKWPKLKKVGLQSNPYEWSQGVKIIDYSNLHPSIVQNSYASIDGIRETAKVVKDCQSTIEKKEDAKQLDDCVKAKLVKTIESPKILEGEKSTLESNQTRPMSLVD